MKTSLLALLLAAAIAHAGPEVDKPVRREGPDKPAGQRREEPKDRRDEFLKKHPELRETMERLKDMTPDERQAWLKEHPEVAAKIEEARKAMKERIDNLTPEQKEKLKAKLKERADNLTPEQKEKLREKLKERLAQMTPDEKAEFLAKHPELKERLEGDKK